MRVYVYRNGDRCPCCGTVLQDKSREWLLEFSALCHTLGLEPREDRPVEIPERARHGPQRTAEGMP